MYEYKLISGVECSMSSFYAGGHVVVQTFWLVLQAVLHEVVHHNSHQEHLRLGEDIDQQNHLLLWRAW